MLPWSAIQYFSSIGNPSYKGYRDASTGSYPVSGTKGDYYKVNVAGTINGTSYIIGEYFGYNGSAWAKIPVDKLGLDVVKDGQVIVTKWDETTDVPPTTTKLLLHMNGEDGDTAVTDRSQSANPVTFHGSAQLDDAQKRFGNTSLLLNGTTDYLTVPSNAIFNPGSSELSFELIARFASVAGVQSLLSRESADTSDKCWKLFYSATNGICFSYSTIAGDWTDEITAPWSPTTGKFYHILVERSGYSINIYVDGTLKISYDCTGDTIHDSSADVWIGASPVSGGSEFFNGWIDEVNLVFGTEIYGGEFIPPQEPYYVIVGYDQTDLSMIKFSDPGISSPALADAGKMRYRVSGDNSYVDMVMQTGAATWEWKNIITNSW